MKYTFEPVIKWSGSKRSQANEIIKYFPKEINTYYEPFCGGCSMLMALLRSNIKVKNYICSDINTDLINLWESIKLRPDIVYQHYKMLWEELNKDDNRNRKRTFYEDVRERYNKFHNELDFMFIMRTTTNGMPRYNKKGEFNNSFHITRNGIQPQRLKNIINEWSDVLNKNNVIFKTSSFEEIIPSDKKDFLYLDPPYANTKGMYFGYFNNEKLFNYLENVKCSYILSYDGISGNVDNTYEIPKNVYDQHLYIKSGNSSFKRTIGKSKNSIVYESIYIKRNE